VAEDVTQDVAGDVLGAAEDGCMTHYLQAARNPRPAHACFPRASLGRHLKDRHVKDAAQDVVEGEVEDVPQDMGHDAGLGLWGPGGAHPPRHATNAAAAASAQLATC